jgi:hypothetical protein
LYAKLSVKSIQKSNFLRLFIIFTKNGNGKEEFCEKCAIDYGKALSSGEKDDILGQKLSS